MKRILLVLLLVLAGQPSFAQSMSEVKQRMCELNLFLRDAEEFVVDYIQKQNQAFEKSDKGIKLTEEEQVIYDVIKVGENLEQGISRMAHEIATRYRSIKDPDRLHFQIVNWFNFEKVNDRFRLDMPENCDEYLGRFQFEASTEEALEEKVLATYLLLRAHQDAK